MISKNLLTDASLIYPDEVWPLALLEIFEGCHFEYGLIRKSNVKFIRELIRIQDTTTSKFKYEKFGFDEAIRRLRKFSDTEVILTMDVKSVKWNGRCIFNESFDQIIGCTMVLGSRRQLKTPPDWDGSNEMLDSYNSEINLPSFPG